MPETSDPFFRFLDDFSPRGWLEGFRLRRRAARVEGLRSPSPLSPDEPLEVLLAGLVPFLVQQEPAGPLAVTRVLAQLLKAPMRLPGGREGLRETLGKRFTELGGTLLPQEGLAGRAVEGIDFEGPQVTLRVRGAEAVYRAQWLVAAMDPGLLTGLLPEEGPGRKLAEHLGGLTPKRLVLTVHWVVPEKVLPRGMAELVLMDGGQSGPVWIQVQATRRAGARGDEESLRTVSASALVGSGVRDAGESGLRLPAAGLERTLEALLPFSVAQRVARSVPLVDGPGALAGAGPSAGLRGGRWLPRPASRAWVSAPRSGMCCSPAGRQCWGSASRESSWPAPGLRRWCTSTSGSGTPSRGGRSGRSGWRLGPVSATEPRSVRPWESLAMAWKCDICGKRPLVGNKVSHANNKSKTRSLPNLQKLRATVDGRTQRVLACTRCIKAGKVTKAA